MNKKKLSKKEKAELNKEAWKKNKAKTLQETREEKAKFKAKAQDQQTAFLECIEAGLNMLEAQKKAGFDLRKHYRLLEEDENYAKEFARARLIANETKAESLEQIADEKPREIYDAQGNAIYDRTELQWRETRISTKKWLLAMRDPSRYSTAASRIQAELTGKGGKDLATTIVITERELEEMAEKMKNESAE